MDERSFALILSDEEALDRMLDEAVVLDRAISLDQFRRLHERLCERETERERCS